MYLNGEEVTTSGLIDNDPDSCVQLPGSDGCRTDKVKTWISLRCFFSQFDWPFKGAF